jgi:hypothetical protein
MGREQGDGAEEDDEQPLHGFHVRASGGKAPARSTLGIASDAEEG